MTRKIDGRMRMNKKRDMTRKKGQNEGKKTVSVSEKKVEKFTE